MGLIDDLGSSRIALDTPVFIYFIEEHTLYLNLIKPVFAAIDTGKLTAVTSVITLLETLVQPYRTGNPQIATQYEALLSRSRGLQLREVTADACRAAAQMRAVYRISTPDALQLSIALLAQCSVFLTNDRKLPDIAGIRIVQLSDYRNRGSGD